MCFFSIVVCKCGALVTIAGVRQQMYLVGFILFFLLKFSALLVHIVRLRSSYKDGINDDGSRWWWWWRFWPPHYSYNECICFSIFPNANEMLMCLRMPHAACQAINLNGENVTSFLFNSRCGRFSVHFPHSLFFYIVCHRFVCHHPN